MSTLPARGSRTRVSASNLRRWRVRLAGWLIEREVERQFRRDGRDITISIKRSITNKSSHD